MSNNIVKSSVPRTAWGLRAEQATESPFVPSCPIKSRLRLRSFFTVEQPLHATQSQAVCACLIRLFYLSYCIQARPKARTRHTGMDITVTIEEKPIVCNFINDQELQGWKEIILNQYPKKHKGT